MFYALKTISLKVRKNLLQSNVLNVALHEVNCGSLGMGQDFSIPNRKLLDFETWGYGRILRNRTLALRIFKLDKNREEWRSAL